MKTEANDLSYPIEEHDYSGGLYMTHNGLTKREYFAAMAMQGILANERYAKSSDQYRSEQAVSMADALIQSLNKTEL